MTPSGPDRFVWVTALGPTDHAVSVQAFGDGRRGGIYQALCGERFNAAAMVAEPEPRCFRCTRYLQARATLRDAEQRLQRVPAARRIPLVRRFLEAVIPPQSPDDSSRTRALPPDESPGRHARRDPDAPSEPPSGSGSRRASTFGRAS